MTSSTNMALMKLHRRAESGDAATLVETFVDVGPLFTLLSSHDHQILYGRRGTGKTHALTYLGARVQDDGDFAALIDLRTVGSTGGLYEDIDRGIAERGTRLLMDVLGQLHESLTDFVLSRSDDIDLSQAMSLLDRFGDAISDVRVVGKEQRETRDSSGDSRETGAKIGVGAGMHAPEIGAGASTRRADAEVHETIHHVEGIAAHRVHFGEVSRVLGSLVTALPVSRIWLLLDEWASVRWTSNLFLPISSAEPSFRCMAWW